MRGGQGAVAWLVGAGRRGVCCGTGAARLGREVAARAAAPGTGLTLGRPVALATLLQPRSPWEKYHEAPLYICGAFTP